MIMTNQDKKVVIAMSGGVDSSVAAALLVEQKYSVTGMMLKLWSDECSESENACCPPEAIDQARQVANILKIPFYVLDVRDLFKQIVVDPFIEAYQFGLTPNPCYLCNQNIRWGIFLNRILDMGNDFLATGHYARINKIENLYTLRKGVDPLKDQSYVLSGLNQTQLAHTLLPLGNYHKTQVRELAREYQLPVAEKPDSQDLCFVGQSGYRDFLRRHSPDTFLPGEIRQFDGQIVGTHDGLANYTIGQRKGLGSGNAEPVYVIKKEISTNELIVGTKSELGNISFSITHLNWISGKTPTFPVELEVKIRYQAQPVLATLREGTNQTILAELKSPLRDITPGQIAVFYQENSVVGSGMIQSTVQKGGTL
jgi:tRNA-specific 2-thiouridylase